MKTAFLFLAVGFEEMEATATIDILRRGGVKAHLVSISDHKKVIGAHQIALEADYLFHEVDYSIGDMLILPGGMPGTMHLEQYAPLKELLVSYADLNKYVAAICAAPSVLGNLGLLEGQHATCYPGFEKNLKGAILSKDKVVVSNQFITSRGPATVYHFALKLLEILTTPENVHKVADGMLLTE